MKNYAWCIKGKGLTQMTLAQYLKYKSKEICEINKCTEDRHRCKSYAYINKHGELLDICAPDLFFQGSSRPYAAIVLPWSGSQRKLMCEVRDRCQRRRQHGKV